MVLGYDNIYNKYTWTAPNSSPSFDARNAQTYWPCVTSDFGPYQPIPNNELMEYAVRTVIRNGRFSFSHDAKNAECKDMITTRLRNADCVGAWQPWGECSNGSRIRKYTVSENLRAAGKPCPHTNGEQEVQVCAENCEGQWTPWSSCTDGRESRTYSIKKEKVAGGTDCVAKDKEVEFRPCIGGTTTTTTSPAPPSTKTSPPSTKTSPPSTKTSPPSTGTSPPSTGAKTTTPPPIPWYKKSIIVAGVKIPVVWLIGGFGFIFAVFMILIIL
jgi:hypothetical protein